jgi:uncharacterized OsmC-like protein
MAVEITGKYVGNLKTEITHGPSGAVIHTAAPIDNNGDGSSFSPTDLVAAALGACMVTILAILATRHGWNLDGSHWRIEKHMNAEPRRIGRLPIEIHLPAGLGERERTTLERAALACPVHRSLDHDIEIPVEFVYDV